MTYDVHLADRIRALLGDEVGVTERRMFGGLAFLVSGNMAVAANSKGALMVRTGADRFDELLDEPGTSMVVMRNRPMSGWLDVDANRVAGRRACPPSARRNSRIHGRTGRLCCRL